VKELEAAVRESALVVFEGHAISALVMNARQQLESAIPTIVEGLKHHARAVAAGTARAILPQPAPEPPKLAVVPAPPMMTVLAIKNFKYIGVQGAVICCGKYRRHDLPMICRRRLPSWRCASTLRSR
jgi:hypothetical protein